MTVQTAVLSDNTDQTRTVTWNPLGGSDTGQGIALGVYQNATVVFQGTFGAGTAILQGSNDGGTTWYALKDNAGNAISATANALFNIGNVPLLVRPSVSGGTGSAITCILGFGRNYF